MSRSSPPIREAMAALAREELRGVEHPSTARLIAYYRGEVPAVEAAAITEHLSLCGECAAVVLDAAEFFADEDEEEVAPAPPLPIPRRSPLRSLAFAYAFAATVAAVSIGLLVFRTPGPSPQPQVNSGLYDLTPSDSQRGEGAQAIPIRFNTPEDSALLILNPAVAAISERTGVRIRRADGSILWRSDDLVRQASGAFHLSLPAGALPPGCYSLELYGLTQGRETLLGTYRIAVEK